MPCSMSHVPKELEGMLVSLRASLPALLSTACAPCSVPALTHLAPSFRLRGPVRGGHPCSLSQGLSRARPEPTPPEVSKSPNALEGKGRMKVIKSNFLSLSSFHALCSLC